MNLKRLAMLMKLRKIEGTAIHHCALLLRILKTGHIVKGYCISPGEICEHYWVRTDEGDLDIEFEIARLYHPELDNLKTVLVESIPDNLKHIEIQAHKDNQQLYELYISDPKTFWDECPLKIKRFNYINGAR